MELQLGAVERPVELIGCRIERRRRQEARARCASRYVTPSHQFPLGVPMSLQRLAAAIDAASRLDRSHTGAR